MDAEQAKTQIRAEVQNTLVASQNVMMTEMRTLITGEMQKLQNHNQKLAESQMAKVEEALDGSYKFKKRGNEEQHKHNVKVIRKLQEANTALSSEDITEEKIQKCREHIAEGIDIVTHREKLVKLADSSESGWRVVQEYQANPLAEDSEDEKRISKAQNRADKKVKAEKEKRKETHRRYFARNGNASGSASKPYSRFHGDRGTKPGRCFGCGEKGHWKNECPKETNEKLSTNCTLPHLCYKLSVDNVDIHGESSIKNAVRYTTRSKYVQSSETEVSCGHENIQRQSSIVQVNSVSPVNSLRSCINEWEKIGASKYIISVIDNGYKLPLKTEPDNVELQNNKSARDHTAFVSQEIEKLVDKRCIAKVTHVPKVVNPLTVAKNKTGKLRLVLDCRHVNPHLFQFKFKYENHEVARVMFQKGDQMFTFDLKSAYHHIMIDEAHTEYLGFAWEGIYYVFKVLPFGLATAGYIFSKVTRELIKFWRGKSLKVVMYLDDGLAGANTMSDSIKLSLEVQSDLKKLGFILAEDKCQWAPSQIVTWLGLIWNMHEGTLHLTEERALKLMKSLDKLITQLRGR